MKVKLFKHFGSLKIKPIFKQTNYLLVYDRIVYELNRENTN